MPRTSPRGKAPPITGAWTAHNHKVAEMVEGTLVVFKLGCQESKGVCCHLPGERKPKPDRAAC